MLEILKKQKTNKGLAEICFLCLTNKIKLFLDHVNSLGDTPGPQSL